MNLIKRIHRQGTIILIVLAAASAFYEWKKLPLSILVGGALGLANIKGLAWGLRDFAASSRPGGKVVFLSIFRFFMIAFILVVLALLKLINLLGVLIGFTVVFILIIKEGLRFAKESSEQSNINDARP
jgi:hypothetical protein